MNPHLIIRKNSRNNVRNAGFTLTELMVTIALAAVITTIGGYGLLKGMPDRRLASATRDLYAWMNEARSLAVRTSQRISIGFDVDANRVTITDAGGRLLRRWNFPDHIDLYKVTSGNPFTFNTRGMKTGVSGSVHIRYGGSDDHRRRVRVTSVGSIAIQYPTGAGDDWK